MNISSAVKFLKKMAEMDLDCGADPSLLSLKFFLVSPTKCFLTYCIDGRSKATATIQTSQTISNPTLFAVELEKAVGIEIDEIC